VVQSDDKLVRLGEEALQVMAPQVYIIQEGPMNPDPAPVSKRPHFRRLPAVVNGRVHRVDEQAWSRPGPRNIAAVEELAAWLHPQRFADKGSMK
jgi:iron complex transport system substrate-binding protein